MKSHDEFVGIWQDWTMIDDYLVTTKPETHRDYESTSDIWTIASDLTFESGERSHPARDEYD